MTENYHDDVSTFKLSYRWFEGFVDVIKDSSKEQLTQPKSHQQLCVTLLRTSMQSLYRSEKEVLTPLSFVICNNTTYEKIGPKEVLIVGGQSGLKERQCTA